MSIYRILSLVLSLTKLLFCVRLTDDRLSAQKTLQTIITNQQTKNLINFKISGTEGQPSGLAATEVLSSTPAAANLLAGTSSNPLDDLVSIFGGMSGLGPSAGNSSGNASGGMGLGGLSFGGNTFGSPTPQAPPSSAAGLGAGAHAPSPPVQAQQPQEDLLGLF